MADLRALNAALKARSFDPVYVFHGDDDFRKDGALKAVIEAAVEPALRDFNVEVRRGTEVDAETLGSLLDTPPMLAERRLVIQTGSCRFNIGLTILPGRRGTQSGLSRLGKSG